MGRAKLNLELIPKEKSRNVTFLKRKKGLMKKLREFTILCGVEGCMIIYSGGAPKHDEENPPPPVEPVIWPENPDNVRKVIMNYKAHTKEERGRRTSDLTDFYKDRKKKVDEQLAKVRRKMSLAKYPTWDDRMDSFSGAELSQLGFFLGNKLEDVRRRVEFLKAIGATSSRNKNLQHQELPSSLEPAMLLHHHHPTFDHMSSIVNPSAMGLMMNDVDYYGNVHQLTSACGDGQYYNYYDPTAAGMLIADNMVLNSGSSSSPTLSSAVPSMYYCGTGSVQPMLPYAAQSPATTSLGLGLSPSQHSQTVPHGAASHHQLGMGVSSHSQPPPYAPSHHQLGVLGVSSHSSHELEEYYCDFEMRIKRQGFRFGP
ncbi:agamous-like MADS-box protein AGL80 [Malania oleifera]|uniref:agamous-like MADS-box protein AGL80 n=1 Tax=Malania oleifera TaxID=397392 RepID=UPI0025ADBA65|nr:agamous-like MADS-box protein AGL80 [Malania oleifera]